MIKFAKAHNINRHFEISVTKKNAELIFSCACKDILVSRNLLNNQIKNQKKKKDIATKS